MDLKASKQAVPGQLRGACFAAWSQCAWFSKGGAARAAQARDSSPAPAKAQQRLCRARTTGSSESPGARAARRPRGRAWASLQELFALAAQPPPTSPKSELPCLLSPKGPKHGFREHEQVPPQASAELWCATAARARARHWAHDTRATLGTCRSTGVSARKRAAISGPPPLPAAAAAAAGAAESRLQAGSEGGPHRIERQPEGHIPDSGPSCGQRSKLRGSPPARFQRHGRPSGAAWLRVSAERVLVNVPAPMLRCSAPVLVLVHMCFYIHAVGSVLLDGARVPQPYAPTFRCSTPLHSCQLLKSCTPMLRSSLKSAPLHSAAALPLRCSDAPLRSVAQPSAPMLRSAPLRKPLLRCSTPSSAAALPLRCSDAPCTSLRCATLRSDAPLRNPLRL